MQFFTMLVGLPGSGKSYYASIFPNAVVHSSDAIHDELFGSEDDQEHNEAVFAEMRRRTIASLQEGKSVIYDANNLNAKKRANFVAYLRRIFPTIHYECIVLVCKLSVCKERQFGRERPVPESVIDHMVTHFQPPYYNEGWDGICVHASGKLYRLDHEMQQLEMTNHDNPHHEGTIANHCYQVCQHLWHQCRKGDEDLRRARFVLEDAGTYHDVGKRKTKVFHDHLGNPTVEAHYFNHAAVGAYMWLASDEARRMDVAEALEIASLIAWHMTPLHLSTNGDGSNCSMEEAISRTYYWGRKKGFSNAFLRNLTMLYEADMLNP